MNANTVKSMIIGHAIGDALGVPVEFTSRDGLERHPVKSMMGYGTYSVPAGAWSDDTSMTLCLLESLGRLGKVDYNDVMQNFLKWMRNSEFTPTDQIFDIGITTSEALLNFENGISPLSCGGEDEHSNGNGSLMRIAPIALYLYAKSGNGLMEDDLKVTHNLSKLTHAHPRSQMGCGIYVFVAVEILAGKKLNEAIKAGVEKAHKFYNSQSEFAIELDIYGRIWDIDKFAKLKDYDIESTGYVVYSLEAALWCLLTTDDYAECVLKAVNLGGDTDTIGAIAGGLAGLYYGIDNIPEDWRKTLIRYEVIEKMCETFAEKIITP
ncbi:MAG: ADP-ribosylglycohydrolase family protein [Selenomonadaceae bacterium]|nr:ADP-ribosylglycohydrolase family protein [Selenomonadaceae bacterium]MBP3723509.1 ADP-ribosylglycohydrolase family protein [Selenomonadaceae bacterium]